MTEESNLTDIFELELEQYGYQIINTILYNMTKSSPFDHSSFNTTMLSPSSSLDRISCLERMVQRTTRLSSDKKLLLVGPATPESAPDSVRTLKMERKEEHMKEDSSSPVPSGRFCCSHVQPFGVITSEMLEVAEMNQMEPQVKELFQQLTSTLLPSLSQPVVDSINKARSNLFVFNPDEPMADPEMPKSLPASTPLALAVQVVESTLLKVSWMSSSKDFNAPGNWVDRCIFLASLLSLSTVLNLDPQNPNIPRILRTRKEMAAAVTKKLHRFLCQELRDRGYVVPPSPNDREGADNNALDSADGPVQILVDPLAASRNEVEPLGEKKAKKKGVRHAFSGVLKTIRRYFTCCISPMEDKE